VRDALEGPPVGVAGGDKRGQDQHGEAALVDRLTRQPVEHLGPDPAGLAREPAGLDPVRQLGIRPAVPDQRVR